MHSNKVILGGKEQSYQRGCHTERLKILYSIAKDTNFNQKNPPVLTTHMKDIQRMKFSE